MRLAGALAYLSAALAFSPVHHAAQPARCAGRSGPAALLSALPERLEAVVLDADGSFLNPEHRVSPANAEAVREARAAGLRVFLATGRARSGAWVDECLAPLDLQYPGTFLQGLTAFDARGERILDTKLAPSVVRAVEEVCGRVAARSVDGCHHGITLAAYVQERLVVACGDSCDPWLARYASYGDGEIEGPWEGGGRERAAGGADVRSAAEESLDETAADALEQIEAERAARGAAPLQMEVSAADSTAIGAVLGADLARANKLLVLSDEGSVHGLRVALEAALADEPARVVKALDWTLEVLPEGASKAAGLKALLEAEGVDPRRVLAVGDGENDIEMMEMVGIPIAMGNAVPKLKEAVARLGGHVTAPNDQSGCAQAIREHALPRAPGAS